MIILKQVIHDIPTNSVEATWVDRIQLPDTEVPESFGPTTRAEDGEIIPGELIPAHTVPGGIQDTQIKCHSYADVQMQMLRDDAKELCTSLDEHEDLIALVESKIVPYVAPPAPKVESVLMVQARKALILEGVSLIEIEAIIDKMPGIQRDLARADWDTAPNVHRDNALVAYIAQEKKWAPDFVDALFVKAAGIKA